MDGIIKWFSRNHVAGNFLMFAVLLAGAASWFSMRKEIFPEVSIETVMVNVPYPNATPEEVERGVIIPVEEAIADVEGIKRIRSTANQNAGTVAVEIETGYELRNVMDDLKTQIDAIDNFPEEAEEPVLKELSLSSAVMGITLVADGADEKALTELAEEIKDELLSYEATNLGFESKVRSVLTGAARITKVSIGGTREYEISLEISESQLEELGLTLGQVAQAVERYSVDLPAGSIRTDSGEIIVRTIGKKYYAKDFAGVPIVARPDGSVVRLGDVAQLKDGFEDVDLSVKYDNERAVVIDVYRKGEQDTTELAKMVEEYVEWKNEQAISGVKLGIWNDQSVLLAGRIDLLSRNALTGLLLVLVVLTLFLRPSLALLVALGIPVSFAGGLWLMPMLGLSINMISLFAFIVVLGIVVDDAIVTGENVYSRIQGGEHPRIAAYKGTHEVGTVVVFGVLTTAVAFTPMLGLSGVSGKIWPNIPLVVIPTLLFSLVQSKLVLPAHLSLLTPSIRKGEERPVARYKSMARWNPFRYLAMIFSKLFAAQRKVASGMEWFIKKVYEPSLRFGLTWRYAMIASFIALFVLSIMMVASGRIKTQFFPEEEGDVLTAKLELAQGVPFERTQEIVNRIEDAAMELGEEYKLPDGRSVVKHVLASSGTQPYLTGFSPQGPPVGTELGEVTIELVPAAQRTEIGVSSEDLVSTWRELVGPIAGVVELTFKSQTSSGGNAIDIAITGRNRERLAEAVAFAKEGLAQFPGVIEISDSSREGKEELQITSLTRAGESLGFTLGEVARQVRNSFFGYEVQELQRGRDEVKVMVRLPEDDRESLETLEELELTSPQGEKVAIAEVVNFEFGKGPAVIRRTDRLPSIKITADVDANTNANEVMAEYQPKVLAQIESKFPGIRWALEGEQEDQKTSVREMGVNFLGAILIIYVLIAIPLRSYFQPLIILTAIPFGLVGGIAGHMLLGMNLSIMSMVGFVALAGVVVNDSLLLVEFVNRYREETGDARQAARLAGSRRFRAIILTSLTTFAGVAPMLAETDMQARFLIPMAVSLGFGILFATVITLFLVPGLYIVIDDFQRAGRWLRQKMSRA
jgi:multidrug efflux pump subunit AcrB